MRGLRPHNDWVLVKIDQFPESRNGIVILEDTTANKVRTATVLSVGPGKRSKVTGERIPVTVEKGEKVAFFRWNLEHQNGKRVTSFLEGFGEDLGLIRANDILVAGREGMQIE